MKTKIITCMLILSAVLVTAQEQKKKATVRIKKVENVNGVETVTDTTYETDDITTIKMNDPNLKIRELSDTKDGKTIKTIIVDNDGGEGSDIKIIEGKELDEEIKKALKEAGVEGDAKCTQKIVIVNDDNGKESEHKGEKKMTKIVMLKKIDITDANAEDVKRISRSAGETDGKLKIEKMNFYPNPNNGKFNLSFNLPDKGDTEISIMNMEGKNVYNEKLSGFSGNYDKEIDISKNAKGVYFVRVEQGKHAQVKKIVLE